MKKLKIYILTVGLFGLGACNDSFLNTTPITKVTEDNFYRTPADGFTALVGCYDGMQQVTYTPIFNDVLSDDAFGGTGKSDAHDYMMMDEFDKSKAPTIQNLYLDNWTKYYAGVYRCNVLLQKLDQIDWGTTPDLKTTYEAETRFIRAYLYFDMVRTWGNIPLLTEPSNDNPPQADPADVFKVIAEDLKFASENLASVTYAAQPVSTHGRVTKWAAESLLARVYLFYTGYYNQTDLVGVVTKSDALAKLEDVIANSGHALVDTFANLWPAASLARYAGEDNKETVFAIKYTYTSDYNGNHDSFEAMYMIGMRGLNNYPYGKGWGAATVNPRLWNAYDDDDTRKVASIISIVDENLNMSASGGIDDSREYTGYYIKKYSPMVDKNGKSLAELAGGTQAQLDQYQDYVSIRYADVLLMAAELGSPNAQSYFDQVRQRAFKSNFSALPVSQSNIMAERRLEFAGEGIRFWDLLRQGVSVASAAIAESTTLLDGGIPTQKTILAANVELTKGLQQIPINQITLSGGKLVQNTGW
ncbi:MAG TPA: RagB/SusD family nutrient uptake outer membrane protein [Cyclobacteriaceae bacterium]|jgi:hypothetical protein|nr:RagB/SusD family nutrient uptake outer membrane protein [Cyclobacteriaceae bacterium]